MLVSVRLDGTWNNPQKRKDPLPYPEVSHFLTRHPLAKIIVVVDTHSVQESGTFLWTGSDSASYESYSLHGVSPNDLISYRWNSADPSM